MDYSQTNDCFAQTLFMNQSQRLPSYLFEFDLLSNIYLVQTEEIERGKEKCDHCHAFSESVLTGVCKAVLPFFLSLSGSFYLILVVSDHFIVWWEWSNCAFCGSLWVKVSKWSTWWYLSFCCDCLLYLFIEVILDADILYC